MDLDLQRRGCAMLAAKKRLPAKAVAAGLQLVIQGAQSQSQMSDDRLCLGLAGSAVSSDGMM